MQTGQDTYKENQLLRKENIELSGKITELSEENLYLKQELAQLKRMIFGSKSERFVQEYPGQLSLDMDIEQKEATQQETEELTYTRKKPDKQKDTSVRLPLPSHLHREEILIEPYEDVAGAKKIGEVITEILEYTPGKFYVEKYIRPKYALPEDKGIVIGELPSFPIPKGNAGAGLLSHIVISKYVDHLPFYRQVKQFKRADITIAESTLNGWFSATCRLLEPLYEKLKEKLQQSSYLMADETPIPVQTKDKPGATHKGYHWVYYSPLDKLVCFDYRKGRGREGPELFLQGFRGTLQTEGYTAYDKFENSIRPATLGRKNYMFAGSYEGAKRAAMMYSFLGTCKINDVEPFLWLKDVLTRISDHSIRKLEELLPGYHL